MADSLVTATCPLMGLGHWKEVRDFVELSHDVAKDEEEDEAKEMILAATATGDDCNKEATNDNSRNDGEDCLAKDTKQARREDATPTKRRRRSRRKWTRRRIPYGQHSSIQYIDLYLPSPPLGKESESKEDSDQSSSTDTIPKIPIRGTIFFVHGGAWGSGKPWMYRLISPTFLKLNFAVVIVGYRVYPNATTIDDQVGDVLLAWEKAGDVIRKSVVRMSSVSCKTRSDATSAGAKDNAHDEWIGNVIMGHSSGAHVAMLMLAQWIQTKLHQQRNSQSTNLSEKDIGINYPWEPNYFIGLSGPYDINDHFDYEANRGVEQISPMKPICGHSRENFHAASPVRRFLALFREQSEDDSMHRRTETRSIQQLTPPILLVHGIEDATVPFTSTADAGRILRSCGLQRCDEIYLDETGHQDVVVHFMFGGPTKDLTLDWLFHCCRDMRNRSSSNIQSRL